MIELREEKVKNSVRKIVLSLLVLTALTGTGFFASAENTEAAECKIISAKFTPYTPSNKKMPAGWYKESAKPTVTLSVQGSAGCVGQKVEVSVSENDGLSGEDAVSAIDDYEVVFPISNTFYIPLKAGEDECDSENDPECQYFIDIAGAASYTTEEQQGSGNLNYDCDGLCFDDWVRGEVVRPGGDFDPAAPNGTCVINTNLVSVGTKSVVTKKEICERENNRELLASLAGISPQIIRKTAWFPDTTKPVCIYDANGTPTNGPCIPDADHGGGTQQPEEAEQPQASNFENEIKENECGVFDGTIWPGCFIQAAYGMYYVIPAFLLAQVAFFFNVMISVTLSSELFQGEFVREAWGIVRDLSNLFFILILLYVAVELILGMAHDAKKTIVKVIIAALLINFSMFFTGVVIDSSNILALVFYNKLQVETNVNGQKRDYAQVGTEKDVSGAMVAAFDPTKLVSQATLDQAKQVYVNGEWQTKERVPAGTLIAMLIIAGVMMYFAMYALFVAAFSFLGRLIELWVLIIASPFAFMSSTIHEMEGLKDWGWKNWFHRLLTASFMASAFMFFLYFIFLLIHSKIFEKIVSPAEPGNEDAAGFIKTVLGQVLPALLILILLLKSVKLAKASAGQLGETVAKWGEKVTGMAGTLALGAATGGAGLLAGAAATGGRATLGRAGGAIAKSETLKDAEAAGGLKGFLAARTRDLGIVGSKTSFDIRNTGLGKAAKMGEGHKGGFEETRERYEEKRKKRAESLKLGRESKEKKSLAAVQDQHQALLAKDGNAHEIELADKRITVLKDRASTASRELRDHKTGGGKENDLVPGDVKGRTYKEKQEETALDVRNEEGERLARKNASVFLKQKIKRDAAGNIIKDSKGKTLYETEKLVNHSTNTYNGKMSEKAREEIASLAKANPGNVELAALVKEMGDAANTAATAVTEAKKAAAAAAHEPTDAGLAAAAARAAADAAAANPTDAGLARAATDAAAAATAAARAAANPADKSLASAAALALGNLSVNMGEINKTLGLGRSINNMEDEDIPHAHHAAEHKEKMRLQTFANTETSGMSRFTGFVASGGSYTADSAAAVAHDVRMGAKLDSGHGGKSDGH